MKWIKTKPSVLSSVKDFLIVRSLVLPAGEVAGKVILALALMAADVALEWVLVTVAAHVDGVKDVVREVDVTVLAVMQHSGVALSLTAVCVQFVSFEEFSILLWTDTTLASHPHSSATDDLSSTPPARSTTPLQHLSTAEGRAPLTRDPLSTVSSQPAHTVQDTNSPALTFTLFASRILFHFLLSSPSLTYLTCNRWQVVNELFAFPIRCHCSEFTKHRSQKWM